MATIPDGQKILTTAASVNTTYGGSDALKALNTWYTMQDVIDTVRPYKVYSALLNQSGTSAPEALVTENTIGSMTITRNSAGVYYFISPEFNSSTILSFTSGRLFLAVASFIFSRKDFQSNT